MKIVVTGGAGYLGWQVVNFLVARADVTEVVVYDNFHRHNYGLFLGKKRNEYEKCKVRVDDILNSRGLREAFEGAAGVCHLGAIAPSPFSDSDPHLFDQVNNWGTAEVCYAVEDLKIPRLVYLSSGAVYGFGSGYFSHLSAPMPVTSYGAAKLNGEGHVARLSEKVQTVIFRSGTVYGVNPSARFDTFVNKFALGVNLGRTLQIYGSGEQHRPVIHVDSIGSLVASAIVGNVPAGLYDAVEENVSVNQITGILVDCGYAVERVFLNQQQRMRDLMVTPDARLSGYLPGRRRIDQEIQELAAQISLC